MIIVKTYPAPSQHYREIVCTAGITDGGEWIRLFPIRYRNLNNDSRYKIFNWISADVEKNERDNRPESYRPIEDSIQVTRFLDSQKDRAERKRFVLPLAHQSMESVHEAYHDKFTTLALFKPKDVQFHAVPSAKDWSDAEKTIINQTGLFDSDDNSPLMKVPYELRCKYSCYDKNCKGNHDMTIRSWEYNWAFFQYRKRYSTETEALKMLGNRWEKNFYDRDGYLIVGNMAHTDAFIIIGHVSFPNGKLAMRQTDLFSLI